MEGDKRKGIIVLKALVLLMFGTCFFWQCANIGMPQGGPRDTIPPKVMAATPEFNKVFFDGKRIYIEFDEYIQIKDQQKEFFSSPLMKKTPTLTVKGRGVQIDIQDTLKENTTYALNFGSAIRDNNENNPLNGFRYVFSTGPYIDSMLVSGYTVDAYKKDSVSKTLIFFFEAEVDSIPDYDSTLLKSSPAAVARAENNGIFIAQNLKPIDYRIYAVEDNNNNFTYDPGVDKVGFLDGVYNPLDLPGFDGWFDTTRNYMTADPQLYFRMFADKQFKRQNLTEKKRPLQHKIELYFNAPFPQIDTLLLEGIDSTRIIAEYPTQGRDTISLWLNVPGEELPDTIKGRISYMRHDSVNMLQPYSETLALSWKYIESREEQRQREKTEKDREKALAAGEEFEEPQKPNPFKYRSNGSGEFNPEQNLTLDFDYPLISVDTAQISLIRSEDDRLFRVRYTIERDSADIRKWMITAPWTADQKYKLEIPAGALVNLARQTNDTIRHEFTVMSPEKYGTLTVNVTGKTDTSYYVLQLLNEGGTILEEKLHVTTGTHSFRYLNPSQVKLRVLEDMNGNGKWDAGDMIARVQPERVEVYQEAGNELMTMKVNWDIEIDVDMNDLFKPIDIMDIRRQIKEAETLRYVRWLEERAKKQEERRRQEQQQQSGSSTGAMQGMQNLL